MRLDEVRERYQHIRLSWAHEDRLSTLTTYTQDLMILAAQAQACRDDDLASAMRALAVKIKHRIRMKTSATR